MKNIFPLLLFLIGMVPQAQTQQEIVTSTVDKNELESHIRFLSDDLLEGRAAGTRGNKIAALYIANQLREYGVKPNPKSGTYYQEFNLKETSAPSFVNLNINGTTYPLHLSFNMPKIDKSGDAVYLDFGTQSDFENADVEGKVIITKGGTQEGQGPRAMFLSGDEKRNWAKANGAIGLIELVTFDEGMWSRLKNYMSSNTEVANEKGEKNNASFFHVWVNTKGDDPGFKKFEALTFGVQSDGKTEKLLGTQNVIGVLEGTDPKLKNEYVIYSAHYDHVGIGRPNAQGDSIYNGARDNNIGVTAVLSMAENLGKYPTKRSALFILFTAEEMGLVGSGYYVENPVLPLNQMVYCFNTDGGGYNNKSLATIVGLNRTTAKKHFEEGVANFGLRAIGDPAPEQNFFDRSDNVKFAQKGIPAPTFSPGFDAFDAEIMKYYHQLGDEADSLDYDYLLKFYQGYVLSGRLIANDPEMPKWLEGDKYEAAWKELHGEN